MADELNGVRRLAKAAAPGLVQFAGRRYLIDPPTVGQALTLMSVGGARPSASTPGTLGPGDAALLRSVLREWWPPRMASVVRNPKRTRQALKIVDEILLARTEKARDELREQQAEEDGEEAEGDEDLPPIDYERVVADYMEAYSMSAVQVLAEPWPVVLLLVVQAGRLRWRAQADRLRTDMIENIKDDEERRQALAALFERAGQSQGDESGPAYSGLDLADETPATPEEQIAKLERLASMSGRA